MAEKLVEVPRKECPKCRQGYSIAQLSNKRTKTTVLVYVCPKCGECEWIQALDTPKGKETAKLFCREKRPGDCPKCGGKK